MLSDHLISTYTATFSAPSASTVRHLYLRGGAGVGSMTKIYGSRKRNGVCPAHYSVGSKNVARKVLQALELLKMIEKDPNGLVSLCCIHLALKSQYFHCANVFWLCYTTHACTTKIPLILTCIFLFGYALVQWRLIMFIGWGMQMWSLGYVQANYIHIVLHLHLQNQDACIQIYFMLNNCKTLMYKVKFILNLQYIQSL